MAYPIEPNDPLLRIPELEKLCGDFISACTPLIDSIKWSGDINQVNIAPKIEPIRNALKKAAEMGIK